MLSRKTLIGVASLFGVATVVVGMLALLRWQADKAAADFADSAQTNLRASTAAAKKNPVLTRATEKLNAGREATKAKSVGLIPRARVMGPVITEFFKASATLLRVEHAGMPKLKAVPLGSRLSASYRGAEVKSAKIEKMYDQAELLTHQAVKFYPNLSEAMANAVTVGFDSLPIAFTSVKLELAIERETGSGSGDYTDSLKSIADQRAAFESISSEIKETPLIPATETRRQAIVKDIDEQVAAFEVAKQALEVGDQKAILKATDPITKGSKNDWAYDFTAVVNESSDIGEDISALADKLNKAIEEL